MKLTLHRFEFTDKSTIGRLLIDGEGGSQDEVWADVIGFEEAYEVSNHGNVRRHIKSCPVGKGGSRPGRLLAPSLTGRYLSVHLSYNGTTKMRSVHRLVADAFIGIGRTVNHIDGDRFNNRLSNLELCSIQENINHAFAIGLRASIGEKNHNAGLFDRDIPDIRMLLSFGMRGTDIAREYGVSQLAISKIKTGRTWRHV